MQGKPLGNCPAFGNCPASPSPSPPSPLLPLFLTTYYASPNIVSTTIHFRRTDQPCHPLGEIKARSKLRCSRDRTLYKEVRFRFTTHLIITSFSATYQSLEAFFFLPTNAFYKFSLSFRPRAIEHCFGKLFPRLGPRGRD